MSSCDDKVNFSVGVFYCGSKGDAKCIEEVYDKILCSIEQCSKCLQSEVECTCTFNCKDCYDGKDVCDTCTDLGYTNWHPLLRPCKLCLENNTDCDPKQKSFMNTMLEDRGKYPYHVPIPDCPHNIKSVRSAEFWKWIDINGYLVNVRLLY